MQADQQASIQSQDPLAFYPSPSGQPGSSGSGNHGGPSSAASHPDGPGRADPGLASVYTAVYSGVSVFECMIRGIAVMRRRRTKILDKEIIPVGLYEKVQGGYGKYQGTWIPLERGLELAAQYGVQSLLAPIVDTSLNDATYTASLPAGRQSSPDKSQAGSNSNPTLITPSNSTGPTNPPSTSAPTTNAASSTTTTATTIVPSGSQSRQILLQQQAITSPFLPSGGSNVAQYPIPAPHHGGRSYNGQTVHSSAMMTPADILAAGQGAVRTPAGAFHGYYDQAGGETSGSLEENSRRTEAGGDRKRARTEDVNERGEIPKEENGGRNGYHQQHEDSVASFSKAPQTKRMRTEDGSNPAGTEPGLYESGAPLAGYPSPFQNHLPLDQYDASTSASTSSSLTNQVFPPRSNHRVPMTTSESADMQRFADSLIDGDGNGLYTVDYNSADGTPTPGHSQEHHRPSPSQLATSIRPSNTNAYGLVDPSLKEATSTDSFPSIHSTHLLSQPDSRPSPGPVQDALAPHTRLASKPTDPAKNADPARQRAILLSFFERQIPATTSTPSTSNGGREQTSDLLHADDPEDPSSLLADPTEPFDPNLIIDPQGHTALHWACALARPNLVTYLLNRGADPHRGNHSGETPLMRSILATNNYDQRAFPSLLSLADSTLALTLRTMDRSHRSVLHHVALLAGVPGRAGAARYYMECLLEWIAKHESLAGTVKGTEGFKSVVDARDINGDTALIVSARVGNRTLTRFLVDVGAEKGVVNKLGLRAGDYGIEEELLRVSPGEEIIASLREPASVPLQKSKDVITDITKTIETLNTTFLAELKVKEDALAVAQSHVVGVTRSLAFARRSVSTLEANLAKLDQITQRTKNVQRALDQEDAFDWSGRTDVDGQPSIRTGPSFQSIEPTRGEDLPVSHPTSFEPNANYTGPDPKVDSTKIGSDPKEELIELRRIRLWQSRAENILEEKIRSIDQISAEKHGLYRKVIAICTGTPIDSIDEDLDKLLESFESEEGNKVTSPSKELSKS
ncbi:Transcription regulator HTH, APSES-type DNA-binding domain [Phaffia rhodozyma]|uniref:Transcription regulator HTH, APSES-type DNA-binding domain n=1 Tax=Phaffia rhodozyma TaxID=264483 RepID=A0A0F7SHW4_PHARH|nr:Transcription regulator HTH, APSES-type DNA-binding domain [Phaffia rhodozyma]